LEVQLPIATADGEFFASYSADGLCRLQFPNPRRRSPLPSPAAIPAKILNWHKLTTAAVIAVLAGRTPRKLPPFDLSRGTDFQQAVWQALQNIGPGHALSYGAIAKFVGRPAAIRAVGGACGANPIPLLVPCHRVLAANERIGGFSGGLDWKRTLLTREGVKVRG
jgi:O-6-methylguanine DNA methyltransferase